MLAWCSISAATQPGVLFGKHKMVPGDQSQKSWEGGGSLISGNHSRSAVGGVPAAQARLGRHSAGHHAGDHRHARRLVESQVKRDMGIKDMRCFAGHGGLMDRIDGVMPSAVATWIVLTLLT